MKAILDSVVFFLWPSINPDGQDIVVNWCRAQRAGCDTTAGAVPMELYEKYVGHDNNRDSYMLNVVESRVIQRTWREWEPRHHLRAAPVVALPHAHLDSAVRRPGRPPRAADHGARGERDRHAHRRSELDANGMPGAVSQLETYDAWYPGLHRLHADVPEHPVVVDGNAGRQLRDAAHVARVADLPRDYEELRPTSLYSSPWAQGKWRLRDAVNYMVTADHRDARLRGAKFKSELLYNRYQAARNTIQQFKTSGPYAYIIPQDQHDPVAPVELLRRMAFMGVRVEQLTATSTTAARATRKARGSSRWTRSTRSSCASSSSRRSIPTWATTRRTTPPAGRCRTRWA